MKLKTLVFTVLSERLLWVLVKKTVKKRLERNQVVSVQFGHKKRNPALHRI